MRSFGLFTIRRSLFAKFTLSFILVGLVPLVVLGYFAFDKVTNQAARYTENQLNQMMFYLSDHVEQKLLEFNNISKLMYVDSELYEQLLEALTTQSKHQGYDISVVIHDYLNTILSTNQYIRHATFVAKDSNEIYNQTRTTLKFDKNQFLWRKWSSRFHEQAKSLQFLTTHPESYYVGSTMNVFTLSRQFMDTSLALYENPPTMGILFLDIDLRVFDRIFDSLNLNQDDVIAILDAEGTVIYANKQELWGQQYVDEAGKQEEAFTLVKAIPQTDFTIVGTFSKLQWYADFLLIRNWISIVAILSLLFLTILALIFSKRLSNPIREIIRQMAKVESGKLEQQVSVKSDDEVGQLARGFNRMTVRLEEFIQVAYLAEIKQKQTELNALKSQIRPHYLYNTLEVIRMSAVAHDVRPVAEMIRALSAQLEYVLDYGQNLVPIEQELEHVHHYFNFVRIRYDDLIQLEVVGLDEVKNLFVLKLSIQPLVENAVQHGLWSRPEGGRIRIRFEIEHCRLLSVSVIDNGIGMSKEKLKEVMDNLQNQSCEQLRKHFGLQNVHDRLHSIFGSDGSITMKSRQNIGTIVRFSMPVYKEEKMCAEASVGR